MRLIQHLSWLLVALAISHSTAAQQVYKWIDNSGQVHYGQQKPTNHTEVQALKIVVPPPSAVSNTAVGDEVARLNALSEQMASERRAAEQARQEQAMRNLERENKALENALLNQQMQQPPPNNARETIIIGDQPPYSPNLPPPCQPWPYCRQRPPPPPLSPLLPLPPPMPMPPHPRPVTQSHPAPHPNMPSPFRGR